MVKRVLLVDSQTTFQRNLLCTSQTSYVLVCSSQTYWYVLYVCGSGRPRIVWAQYIFQSFMFVSTCHCLTWISFRNQKNPKRLRVNIKKSPEKQNQINKHTPTTFVLTSLSEQTLPILPSNNLGSRAHKSPPGPAGPNLRFERDARCWHHRLQPHSPAAATR